MSCAPDSRTRTAGVLCTAGADRGWPDAADDLDTRVEPLRRQVCEVGQTRRAQRKE